METTLFTYSGLSKRLLKDILPAWPKLANAPETKGALAPIAIVALCNPSKEIQMFGTASSITADFEPGRWERGLDCASESATLVREGTLVDVGLSNDQRGAVVAILNTVLADEFVIYVKSRRFHWNVEGPNFTELHGLFEKQYEQLGEIVDRVAERARALGGFAAGSLEQYLRLTRLKEQTGAQYLGRSMIGALLADHEALIRSLREDVEFVSGKCGDEGTTDFLIGLMQEHEKIAWMLRAYLR